MSAAISADATELAHLTDAAIEKESSVSRSALRVLQQCPGMKAVGATLGELYFITVRAHKNMTFEAMHTMYLQNGGTVEDKGAFRKRLTRITGPRMKTTDWMERIKKIHKDFLLEQLTEQGTYVIVDPTEETDESSPCAETANESSRMNSAAPSVPTATATLVDIDTARARQQPNNSVAKNEEEKTHILVVESGNTTPVFPLSSSLVPDEQMQTQEDRGRRSSPNVAAAGPTPLIKSIKGSPNRATSTGCITVDSGCEGNAIARSTVTSEDTRAAAPACTAVPGQQPLACIGDDRAVVCEAERRPPPALTKRELWLKKCFEGRLSDCVSLDELAGYNKDNRTRDALNDFRIPNVMQIMTGTISQFDQNKKLLLPPLAADCCETFCSLTALCLASFPTLHEITQVISGKGLNYFVYFSAWMHQLTAPLWGFGVKKQRPQVADVERCLGLRDAVKNVHLVAAQFVPVFYYQKDKVIELLEKLRDVSPVQRQRQQTKSDDDKGPSAAQGRKRPRHGEEGEQEQKKEDHTQRTRGYIVVSGDFTLALVSSYVPEQGCNQLLLLDSHGLLPWSNGRACVCGFQDRTHTDRGEKVRGFDLFAEVVLAVLQHSKQIAPPPEHERPLASSSGTGSNQQGTCTPAANPTKGNTRKKGNAGRPSSTTRTKDDVVVIDDEEHELNEANMKEKEEARDVLADIVAARTPTPTVRKSATTTTAAAGTGGRERVGSSKNTGRTARQDAITEPVRGTTTGPAVLETGNTTKSKITPPAMTWVPILESMQVFLDGNRVTYNSSLTPYGFTAHEVLCILEVIRDRVTKEPVVREEIQRHQHTAKEGVRGCWVNLDEGQS